MPDVLVQNKDLAARLFMAMRSRMSILEAQQLHRDLGTDAKGFTLTGPDDSMHCVWEDVRLGTFAAATSLEFKGHFRATDFVYISDLYVTEILPENHVTVTNTIALAEAEEE